MEIRALFVVLNQKDNSVKNSYFYEKHKKGRNIFVDRQSDFADNPEQPAGLSKSESENMIANEDLN